jgi:hypothetical protein
MADEDVGASFTGRYPSVSEFFRQSPNLVDRTNEPWPYAPMLGEMRSDAGDPLEELPQSVQPAYLEHIQQGRNAPIPLASPMAAELGAQKIHATTPRELRKFLQFVDSFNEEPPLPPSTIQTSRRR